MVLIVVTQFFTNKSTTALTIGNRQAVKTFLLNNSIQDLVNTSFDLEGKFKNSSIISDKNNLRPLADSLTRLGYHAYVIVNNGLPEGQDIAETINNIVDSQVYISERIIKAAKSSNSSQLQLMTDSLRMLKPGEKVYENCLKLQEELKSNLQQTLDKNSDQAGKLSFSTGYWRFFPS
ncbi:hypothetical protein [Niabella ginsengisoli]|uniref:Uncharacterized protein n=1 Tax=Niabella ginsengisoli TaxID=522298 RepID=A0ABS9SQE8_9BACT|nr:hypothetical protein [Niabella ginsengisoli]MCH5600471.1 hypothetical protein [Niabella ginsengisoli]